MLHRFSVPCIWWFDTPSFADSEFVCSEEWALQIQIDDHIDNLIPFDIDDNLLNFYVDN
jgi:hypothetical protein